MACESVKCKREFGKLLGNPRHCFIDVKDMGRDKADTDEAKQVAIPATDINVTGWSCKDSASPGYESCTGRLGGPRPGVIPRWLSYQVRAPK
jgi:hypothetical protein